MLQAFVSEPIEPLIDVVISYDASRFYISQSDKGTLVFGGDLDGYNSYAQRGNLPVIEDVMSSGVALIPSLSRLRFPAGVRQATVAASACILASTLSQRGDLEGARALEERVLEARRHVLGEEHPDTLASMNNLAHTLRATGAREEALALLQATAERLERTLGANSSETLKVFETLLGSRQATG